MQFRMKFPFSSGRELMINCTIFTDVNQEEIYVDACYITILFFSN
jgi:hypothetical protein